MQVKYFIGRSEMNVSAEWCSGVVSSAIDNNENPEIINSDQGSQFTSSVYIDLLTEKGMQISMDVNGRVIDNIFIERL